MRGCDRTAIQVMGFCVVTRKQPPRKHEETQQTLRSDPHSTSTCIKGEKKVQNYLKFYPALGERALNRADVDNAKG